MPTGIYKRSKKEKERLGNWILRVGKKTRFRVIDLNKRFWDKVNKKTNIECWEWKARKNWGGYG